ncbi:MAG: hypothetical protein JXN62_12310, partial [Bacteroidales bacterium]|nr:hypothetical protein [Bacteroidales bacterium]
MGYMNEADEIRQENEVSFFINKPFSIFNTFSIDLQQFNAWNFNSTYLGSGAHLSFSSQFRNNYGFRTNLIYHSQGIDTRKLRGGPDMLMPHTITTFGSLSTDDSKNLFFGLSYNYERYGNNSGRNFQLQPRITIRPFSMLKISVNASYSKNNDKLQYVTSITDFNSEQQFFLGTIDQKTLGLTFRADLNITPELAVQFYGSPFISRGSYSEFKRITSPENKEFDQRFTMLSTIPVDQYLIVLYEPGIPLSDYLIRNPDFNFHEFRSNLVARWEFRPGSFIYLVWSSDRKGSNIFSDASLGDSYRMLGDAFSNNIFMIKVNYWFSL